MLPIPLRVEADLRRWPEESVPILNRIECLREAPFEGVGVMEGFAKDIAGLLVEIEVCNDEK
jgi:hypothetical protein